jgi:nucleoside-diphosphate-sugar epimerase
VTTNVLVVGGAGYVGGIAVDLLQVAGYEVRVYDALLYEETYRKPVDFAFGDVRDGARLLPHLRWADAVIWLAALVGDPACALQPEAAGEINEAAVRFLAEHYDGRIAFASTCSVYGARDGVLDEQAATRPLSVYASTKLRAERHLAGKDALVFRLGTLFGVGDCFSRVRLDLVVNALTVKAHRLGRITLFGGEQWRPLLHVHDVARALVDNLECAERGIFNLHAENLQIRELVPRLRAHFPALKVEEVPTELADTRDYRVSSERARERLRFVPTRRVDDGIREMQELLASNRLRDPENPRYTNQTYLSLHHVQLRGDHGG